VNATDDTVYREDCLDDVSLESDLFLYSILPYSVRAVTFHPVFFELSVRV